MANDVEITPLQWDLVNHADENGHAIEELRQALNSIIGKYKLHPSVVISMLARISAAYISLAQAFYKKKNVVEFVEADFVNMLSAHLLDKAVDKFLKK